MNATQDIDICDIVEYGVDKFSRLPITGRVTHFLRKETWTEFNRKRSSTKNHELAFIIKLSNEDVREERKLRRKNGQAYKCRYRLLYCTKENATHVSLSGIGGGIASINKCKRIRTANWPNALIEQTKNEATSDFWLQNEFPIEWQWE